MDLPEINERELLEMRERREGGFRPCPEGELVRETEMVRMAPSPTPISEKAISLIVRLEVASPAAYDRLYQRPLWPRGRSGVTIGVGYDLGYVNEAEFDEDWADAIDADVCARLKGALRQVGGTPDDDAAIEQLVASLADVAIPFATADQVFRAKVLPRYVALAESSLENTGDLSQDSLGALTSLVYNRGASFGRAGDRFTEMRAIKAAMGSREFPLVPPSLRAMARLWPDSKGLRDRRQAEAQLFEEGLS